MEVKIAKLKEENIKTIAEITSAGFSGLKDIKKAKKWIYCNFKAFPRFQYFVAKSKNKILGYILWTEKGGFREKSVWELEQIAIEERFRGQGIGKKLIRVSLSEIRKYLRKRKSTLKLIEVTTGTENRAQKLYKEVLGAEVEAIIKDFFQGNEAIMIARNIKR